MVIMKRIFAASESICHSPCSYLWQPLLNVRVPQRTSALPTCNGSPGTGRATANSLAPANQSPPTSRSSRYCKVNGCCFATTTFRLFPTTRSPNGAGTKKVSNIFPPCKTLPEVLTVSYSFQRDGKWQSVDKSTSTRKSQ